MRRYRRSGAAPRRWSSGPRLAHQFCDPTLEALVTEALEHNAICVSRQRASRGARLRQGCWRVHLSVGSLLDQKRGSNLSGDDSGLQWPAAVASWSSTCGVGLRSGRAAGKAQYASAELDASMHASHWWALVAKSWFLATEARLQKGIAEDMGAARPNSWSTRRRGSAAVGRPVTSTIWPSPEANHRWRARYAAAARAWATCSRSAHSRCCSAATRPQPRGRGCVAGTAAAGARPAALRVARAPADVVAAERAGRGLQPRGRGQGRAGCRALRFPPAAAI